MAKDMSEQEIQELLEDRKNGMGLQKAAKKYGIGVPRIRRLEKENGVEPPQQLSIAKPQQMSIEDIQKHFLEVQESFAIVLDELQKTREELQNTKRELLDRMEQEDQIEDWLLEEEEDLLDQEEEELENLEEKVDWQIGTSTVFGVVGAVVAGIVLLREEKSAKPIHYYVPVEEIPTKKSKIPEME